MQNTQIIQLPSFIPTDSALKKVTPMEGVVCLSGSWAKPASQEYYDIISACPSIQLKEHNDLLYIEERNIEERNIEEGNVEEQKAANKREAFNVERTSAFDWLGRYLETTKTTYIVEGAFSNRLDLPLVFGFIGYISYDYSKKLESLPNHTIDDTAIADLRGGIYHWNLINDTINQITYLAFGPYCSDKLKEKVLDAFNQPVSDTINFELTSKFACDSSKSDYTASFDQIKKYINSGDCYQINYSHRFKAQYKGSTGSAFSYLKNKLNTPYSGFLEFDDFQIISLSPERFIKVNGNHIETKPIKGTIKRGDTITEDQALVKSLQDSKKDRAENLMIVDLIRNDLNRTCIPGTVKVPELFTVETYPNVHHLVSTIVGEKPPATSPLSVFKQAFPGGSITGAPKIRAMEIIEELESTRRSIYCGSIFYAGFDGGFDSNICIRTLLCKDNSTYCWGGGGIVADSNCDDEYQESITKIKNLMDELEHMSGLK